MLHVIFVFAAAAALLHAAGCCVALLVWLWRRRRLRVPPRRFGRSPVFEASNARRKPDWVRTKVIYLAAHLRSCRAVAMAFNRWHGLEVTIGKTCAWEIMRRHATDIEQLRRQIKATPPPRIPVSHSWALDLTRLASSAGASFTVLGILDAGSRKLLLIQALPRKCAFTILGHLLLAFAKHGLPRTIRTDNEAMFTSRLWTATLRALAVTHRRGPPAQPWRNGRMERLFGTLKGAVGGCWSSCGAALQIALGEFQAHYNLARPHQALGGSLRRKRGTERS